MGSFFLNDSYRMADDMALFKDGKPANYSSNGIFENNLCFKNIKRGLGFETENDGSDDWTSRARASPVVERLIFEELRSDIVEYAGNIGINMDPREWCVEDTQKWLRWVGNLYHIGDLTNCLSYDGQTLCSFTEEEFILLTGTKDVGQKIAAQLDIWKNVTKITPSAGSYHFRQQQAMSQKIEREEANNAKMLDTNCWKPSAPQQFPNSQETLPQNQFGSRVNNDSMVGGSRGNFPPNMRTGNLYPAYTESFPSDPPQERCTPRPTIPLDRFRSVRQSYQDNGYLPWEKYQEFTSFNRGPQGVMFSLATEKEGIAMTNTPGISGFQLDKVETKKEPGPPLSTAPMPATITSAMPTMPAQMPTPDEGELTDLSNPMNNELQADFPELALLEPKTEKVVEPCPQEVSMDTLEAKGTIDKTTRKKSTKHPIHLWEFLKQLLHDGKDCIRWIDQEKGVFKIYNSQEVAKFWGERKNRPAMNYDKLSRSIRQYYKKGIIKKTSQGKRLVYQFCEGYL